MSNIQSLVLNVEQLINQHKTLQQQNQQLRLQVGQLEQALVKAQQQAASSFSQQDIDSLQRLHNMVDEHLAGRND